MSYQDFRIYLVNGHMMKATEEVEKPAEEYLINRFHKAMPDGILVIGDAETAMAFIPVRNILYISTDMNNSR